jgi:hypothetical protein
LEAIFTTPTNKKKKQKGKKKKKRRKNITAMKVNQQDLQTHHISVLTQYSRPKIAGLGPVLQEFKEEIFFQHYPQRALSHRISRQNPHMRLHTCGRNDGKKTIAYPTANFLKKKKKKEKRKKKKKKNKKKTCRLLTGKCKPPRNFSQHGLH